MENAVFSVVVKPAPAGHHHLELQGELDLNHASILEQATADIAADDTLILDLSQLKFMDSTGIRLIMTLYTRSNEENWTFQLVPGPERVQRAFHIAGLERILPFKN